MAPLALARYALGLHGGVYSLLQFCDVTLLSALHLVELPKRRRSLNLLFSASWSYDAYMILKPSGPGPVLWKEDLLASPLLYLLAGLLWNLDWTPALKVHLTFTTDDWPKREAVELRHLPLIPYMAPFATLHVFVVGIFFMSPPQTEASTSTERPGPGWTTAWSRRSRTPWDFPTRCLRTARTL